MSALTFGSTTFSVIDQAGQQWLTQAELAGVLYGTGKGGGQTDTPLDQAERLLKQLYRRHAVEFTPSMTALTEMHTAGGKQQVRIYSLRGAHLLGMLARTPKAAEFRRWVLDLLEQQTHIPGALFARLQAAERAELQSFAKGSDAGSALVRRKKEKPVLACLIAQVRADIQLSLALVDGSAA